MKGVSGYMESTVFLPNRWKRKDAEERGLDEQRSPRGVFGQHYRASLELDYLDYIMDIFIEVLSVMCVCMAEYRHFQM